MKKIPGKLLFALLLALPLFGLETNVSKPLPPQIEEMIRQLPKEKVIDARNSLPDRPVEWERYRGVMIGSLLFLGGFVCGRLWMRYRRNRPKAPPPDPLIAEIEKADTPKALLQLLLAREDVWIMPYADRLEAMLYHDAKEDFASVKRDLIRELGHVS